MVASVFETDTGVFVGGTDVNVAVGETSAVVGDEAGIGVAGGVPHVTASNAIDTSAIIAKESQL